MSILVGFALLLAVAALYRSALAVAVRTSGRLDRGRWLPVFGWVGIGLFALAFLAPETIAWSP